MQILGPEPSVVALRDRLDTELPAIIDAINATAADSVVMEHPAQVLTHVPNPGELVQFPTIGIERARATVADDIGTSFRVTQGLVVLAYVQNADQPSLVTLTDRWIRAIQTAVRLPGGVPTINLGFGPALPYSVQFRGSDSGPASNTPVPGLTPPATWWTWCGVALDCVYEEE